MKVVINGIYRHYKDDNLCKVMALVKDSETLKDMVVYEALYPNPLSRTWVRPYFEWSELVRNREGQMVNRYTFVKETETEEGL